MFECIDINWKLSSRQKFSETVQLPIIRTLYNSNEFSGTMGVRILESLLKQRLKTTVNNIRVNSFMLVLQHNQN